jgi:hypothetical protein
MKSVTFVNEFRFYSSQQQIQVSHILQIFTPMKPVNLYLSMNSLTGLACLSDLI